MGVGMILLEILAVPLTSAFGLSGTTESLCISAISIISLSFLFAGFNIALQGVFQALEGGIESLVVSVCRQFIFVVPVALAFSTLALKSMDSAWTVWLTFPIAEFASAIISWLFLRRTYKKKINNL